MLEISTLENNDYYSDLLSECLQAYEPIENAKWLLILGYFKVGNTILEYMRQGKIKSEYGNSTMARLQEDMRKAGHPMDVYRAVQHARLFSTEEKLMLYYKENPGCTWTSIRENILPKATDHPERYGGVENVTNETMNKIEKLGLELEALWVMIHNEDVPLETREEAVGVMEKAFEVMEELSETRILPTTKIERSHGYLEYIHSFPCMICDKTPVDAHHVEKAGVALKGSDYITVPLCREHHSQIDELGCDSFERLHVIDFYEYICNYLAAYIQTVERAICYENK